MIDDFAGDKHPEAASRHTIDTLKEQVEGEAGCIVIDRQGRIGWAYNSQDTAVAYMTEALQQPTVFTRKDQPLAIA